MVGPQRPTPDLSLYPWSQRRLDFVSDQSNPFPRYGAAVNSVASKEGDIYLMGGLINGSTVKGDLWIVEAASGNLNCYPVPTTAEGPGPRVGHASLLVGNAFIVFGGDTKIDESDLLDDTLYLLNTCELTIHHSTSALTEVSNETLVTGPASWATSVGAIWTYSQHTRFQDLHIWWASRRIFFQ